MTEITNFITNDYKAINCNSSVVLAQDFFSNLSFSHFPVLEDGIYVGCLAISDLESFDDLKTISDYKYSFEGFFAREKMAWIDVLEIFAKNSTNLVPVLNDKNEYLGYYEMVDILLFFQKTPFLQEAGSTIEIKKKTIDYTIGEITQIIESNNGKILGLFLSQSDATYTTVTIKIGVGIMNEIIQSFRRYNYEIVSEHFDDNYINTLKERSLYLERYFNI